MKKLWVILMLSLAVTGGCLGRPALMPARDAGAPMDVFAEVTDNRPVPPGYADLRISATLKTHKPGIYPLDNGSHGTADYRLLVNIDGQLLRLNGLVGPEDSSPRWARDPEAGEGMRYRFRAVVRLKAGMHRVMAVLPEDGVSVEREIDLADGSVTNLVLEPVYGATAGRQRPGSHGVTTFRQGVDGLRMERDSGPLPSARR